METINLEELTKGEVRNLTGHERGNAARELFGLDRLDNAGEPVHVIVPDELDAITTSFFQGMFARSVRSFENAEAFLASYQFDASPSILQQVHRGIDRVLTPRGTALA